MTLTYTLRSSGHTGKDEGRGARGSNAIIGDADVMVSISGDVVRTATIVKANDSPEGPLFSFKSSNYEFGVDEDGDPITVNIVTGEVCEPHLDRKVDRAKLPKAAIIALRALTEVVDDWGSSLRLLMKFQPMWKLACPRFQCGAKTGLQARNLFIRRRKGPTTSLQARDRASDFRQSRRILGRVRMANHLMEHDAERRTPLKGCVGFVRREIHERCSLLSLVRPNCSPTCILTRHNLAISNSSWQWSEMCWGPRPGMPCCFVPAPLLLMERQTQEATG